MKVTLTARMRERSDGYYEWEVFAVTKEMTYGAEMPICRMLEKGVQTFRNDATAEALAYMKDCKKLNEAVEWTTVGEESFTLKNSDFIYKPPQSGRSEVVVVGKTKK